MWDYLQYESYLILQTIISQKNHLSSSTIDYCHVFFECSKYCFYMTADWLRFCFCQYLNYILQQALQVR